MTKQMSDKHTKAPWHVEYELDENKEKTDLIFVAHTETECDMTAVAHILNVLATDEENKANAYLIASAPELLAALQEAILWDSHDDHDVPAVWLDAAKAAISKSGVN